MSKRTPFSFSMMNPISAYRFIDKLQKLIDLLYWFDNELSASETLEPISIDGDAYARELIRHLDINRNAIANQIIRYKDAFKMPEGQICIPYIIYGKDEDSQRASIVLFGEKEDYIFAKAYYYVISEPDNMYEGTRNEIISMVVCDETKDVFNEAMERYFVKKEKAGLIQRFADRRLFKDYDEMIELARVRGEKLQEEAKEELPKLRDDAQPAIYSYIMQWFLLKKFCYVQFMMDKRKLQEVFEGNVKKQRHGAKDHSDAIAFISYREMWQIAKGYTDEEKVNTAAEG